MHVHVHVHVHDIVLWSYVMRRLVRVPSAHVSSVGAGGMRCSVKCIVDTMSRSGAMLSVSLGLCAISAYQDQACGKRVTV